MQVLKRCQVPLLPTALNPAQLVSEQLNVQGVQVLHLMFSMPGLQEHVAIALDDILAYMKLNTATHRHGVLLAPTAQREVSISGDSEVINGPEAPDRKDGQPDAEDGPDHQSSRPEVGEDGPELAEKHLAADDEDPGVDEDEASDRHDLKEPRMEAARVEGEGHALGISLYFYATGRLLDDSPFPGRGLSQSALAVEFLVVGYARMIQCLEGPGLPLEEIDGLPVVDAAHVQLFDRDGLACREVPVGSELPSRTMFDEKIRTRRLEFRLPG